MKIVCQRERLLGALQVAGSTVGPTTTRPVLQDVKLEVENDTLALVATDLEVGVRFRLPDVDVERTGAALVPARRFTEIVRVSDDEILELEWKDSMLEIRGRRSQFRVLGEDPEEFPGIPEVGEEGAAGLPAGVLREMLRRTAFAAAAQSTRYTLNGIFWEVDGKKFLMTATDGHRLAHVERVLSTPAAAPASGIVPSKAAALMERSLMPDEDVLFRLGENDLLVRTDRVTIYARLLEGTFPRYREVIPASHPARMEAAVGELERGVRQAAVLTSDESRAVKFRFEADRLILTSATLRTANSFDYMRDRLGAVDVEELALESPFDFRSAALVYLPTDMPEPNQDAYQGEVEQAILQLALAAEGRLMVLFTSYAQLTKTADVLRPHLEEAGFTLFVQGEGGSRQQLLAAFRQTQRAVLLGTRSFWEGVDVQGEALSALIITRLPFAVPTDPIVSARSETFDSPFFQYSVPEAILHLRQGFGRLIRSSKDRGVCVLLDRRLTSKSYGRMFLESLPDATIQRGPLADMPRVTRAWLDGETEVATEPEPLRNDNAPEPQPPVWWDSDGPPF